MAATGNGRSPAKKPKAAAAQPASGSPDASPGIVRLVPRKKDEAPAPRVPVFAVTDDEGEEHVHDMPESAGFSVVAEYGYRAGQHGPGAAIDWLLDKMLTPAGYEALRTYPDLTPVQFGQVLAAVMNRALGPPESPKGS